jgi:CheR methyltransferase-like protein/flagellar motor switch protein FliM/N
MEPKLHIPVTAACSQQQTSMQRVLNQEEIDAIVQAARGQTSSGPEVEKSVQSCDFRQAGQLSRELVQAVSGMFEGFARNLSQALGVYLPVAIQTLLVSVEQLTYKDFLVRTPEVTYFDGVVRKRIVQHFYNNLLPNSYLFVGHAESLYGINNDFHLVHFPGATAYFKPEKRIGGGARAKQRGSASRGSWRRSAAFPPSPPCWCRCCSTFASRQRT